ncbi:PhnB protein [Alkalibacterium subtropicum]|uniref:PhnB protein n=1 Tax=Alkalibacterium subtropicum TaxID=753702 RepID=A0A1I1KG41_9LACT|nr:VOC family protein [Alkalibacterium subtropicum]SFC59242.1 PhnB protein [Alkalibacterium subtropicum]
MTTSISPYLMLNGNAREAIAFYTAAFDTNVDSMDFYKDWPKEMGGAIPEGYGDKIMHASIAVGDSHLMLADTFPDQPYAPGSVITLMLDAQNVTEAESLFKKLSAEGEVIIPLAETSFSPAYGQVKDPFGIEWQIVTDSAAMNSSS